MAKSYYLFKHRNGTFYADILNPETGAWIARRSTGTKNRDEAILKIGSWLRDGIPAGRREKPRKPRMPKAVFTQSEIIASIANADLDTAGAEQIALVLRDRGLLSIPAVRTGPGREKLTDFLLRFWNYDDSPYIREKLAHGHSMGRNHCYQMTNRINNFYIPYFKNRTLESISRQDLKEFSMSLIGKREKPMGYKGMFAEKLSASYINKILKASTTAFSWAFKEGLIPADPSAGLVRFSGTPQKRGVLSPKEATAVFKAPWEDQRAYVGNLLAAVTGLRSGEVLALRKSDIDLEKPILYVRHNYSIIEGLKAPKNGEARRVPLLPEVREKLLGLLAENPHKVDDPFIFYGLLQDKPADNKILIKGLKDACKAVGIDAVARGIVFHSWRHFFSARLMDKMDAQEIMRITGHRSQDVFDIYQDHIEEENLEKMGQATREVMGNIIPFDKAAGE